MYDLAFTSTYRIPLVEQNITPAKRQALKEYAAKFQNVLYPQGNNGSVRVSIRKRLDAKFEQKIRQIGFKVFQKFERHNVPKSEIGSSGVSKLDVYINEQLNNRNYQQFGRQMAPRQN